MDTDNKNRQEIAITEQDIKAKAIFIATLKDYSDSMDMSFTENMLEALGEYYTMVVAGNRVMNLTAITEPIDFAIKHIFDSLVPMTMAIGGADFLKGGKVLDMGTGAGLPGIPLKIYQPKLNITLMDALRKRITFLDNVISAMALGNIKTIHARAEELAGEKKHREAYDIVTSRAVASLPVLLEYTLPLVKVGGYFLAYKSRDYEAELATADKALKTLGADKNAITAKTIELPLGKGSRSILAIPKITPTPKTYPRKAGTPEKKPIL